MKDLFVLLSIAGNMVLAGIFVSVGSYVYLNHYGYIGALLFCVGMIAVFHYNLFLYTCKTIHVKTFQDFMYLLLILCFNLIGCWIASRTITDARIIGQCTSIVEHKMSMSYGESIVSGIFSGLLITLAFTSWKEKPWIALIAIPSFLIGGFNHIISDAFFYMAGNCPITKPAISSLIGTAIGNFIGGRFALNFIFNTKKEKEIK